MAKAKFKWNMNTFAQLRTDPKVMALIEQQAKMIALRAGEGFVATNAEVTAGTRKFGPRGRAAVIAASREADIAEAEDHVLLKALG